MSDASANNELQKLTATLPSGPEGYCSVYLLDNEATDIFVKTVCSRHAKPRITLLYNCVRGW